LRASPDGALRLLRNRNFE
jgi:hypothetical protein